MNVREFKNLNIEITDDPFKGMIFSNKAIILSIAMV
jgi:hypothetical protein